MCFSPSSQHIMLLKTIKQQKLIEHKKQLFALRFDQAIYLLIENLMKNINKTTLITKKNQKILNYVFAIIQIVKFDRVI